jgi:hypothetical protein
MRQTAGDRMGEMRQAWQAYLTRTLHEMQH